MKIGYFVKSHGETIDDTVYCDEGACLSGDLSKYIKRECAKMVAEYAYDYHAGREWLHDSVITLVIDGKEEGDYEIEIEYTLAFAASEIKEKEKVK